MLFSTATGYALRALAAMPEDGSYSLAKDLASNLGLPGPYLAKILQTLAQEGMLTSVRGPRGGFRLARPAHRITVGEVVGVLDGMDAMSGCVMGFINCDGAQEALPPARRLGGSEAPPGRDHDHGHRPRPPAAGPAQPAGRAPGAQFRPNGIEYPAAAVGTGSLGK